MVSSQFNLVHVISLHMGIAYVADSIPFCSDSSSRHHDPPAIWCRVKPVLAVSKVKYSLVNVIHFFSDGPSMHCKQKGNFYFMSKIPFQLDILVLFNGIGGALKRKADRIVKIMGQYISDALDSTKYSSHKIHKLFYIDVATIK